jgi:TfoX/Sxy family transcriptional regulator of competence genes
MSKPETETMRVPKPSEKSIDFFRSIVPDDYRVAIKPMFGNLSAFVNGNMFMGLYGDDIFIRLPNEEQAELLDIRGSEAFAPMGRRMREYIILPKSFREKPAEISDWVGRSLEWALTLPPKEKSRSKLRAKK